MRREFLQLADTYAAAKHKIAGWFISEKLDGTRCFWDGGVSRGCKTADVPWASVLDPKTGAFKNKVKPYATGLWSRYGNPIIAPDWWLNMLPACPLDGELWAGRGNFQLCRSICGGDEPDPRFNQIQYAVYSTPGIDYVFGSGEIKNANMVRTLDWKVVDEWIRPRITNIPHYAYLNTPATFSDELMFLRQFVETQNDRVFMHKQMLLPDTEEEAREVAIQFVKNALDEGGEGAVLRDPSAMWTPKRHKGILKYKPFEDAEGIITGYVAGKEGKQGNVLGKIGALKVKTINLKKNVEFEIGSGLSFALREFVNSDMAAHAAANPGKEMPAFYQGRHLQTGDTITFKYRELSDEGIPKEGRFWRKRDQE